MPTEGKPQSKYIQLRDELRATNANVESLVSNADKLRGLVMPACFVLIVAGMWSGFAALKYLGDHDPVADVQCDITEIVDFDDQLIAAQGCLETNIQILVELGILREQRWLENDEKYFERMVDQINLSLINNGHSAEETFKPVEDISI